MTYMLPDGLKNFLSRVKGDPFASIYMDRGKVKRPELQFHCETEIPPDCFFSYRIYLTKFDTAYLDVEVNLGGEIDLLITNEYNFGRYMKAEEFIYIVGGSILKLNKISNVFVAQEDGMYHIILDNTYYPVNGARPNYDINGGSVKVLLSAKTHTPLQMDFEKPVKI
jgi:hypothetical protein